MTDPRRSRTAWSPSTSSTCSVPERAALVDLLAGLAPDDWDRPTECPAWTVRGDRAARARRRLSLLSRQRDAEVPSLLTESSAARMGRRADRRPRPLQRAVGARGHVPAPALIVDLLERTGIWTHDWYTTVDPDSIGEIVMLFGLEAAPYRSIAAREYVERWVHHLQIRRALGLDAGLLGAPPLDRRGVRGRDRAPSRRWWPSSSPSTEQTIDDRARRRMCRPTSTTRPDDTAHGWAPRAGRVDDPP